MIKYVKIYQISEILSSAGGHMSYVQQGSQDDEYFEKRLQEILNSDKGIEEGLCLGLWLFCFSFGSWHFLRYY